MLNTLNIPATHQSLALHAKALQGEEDPARYIPNPLDNPRCQNRSPYEQLCAGIRCLDCRFDLWTSTDGEEHCLYAYHGVSAVFNAREGYTLAAVLHSVRLFLQQHPTETVIVRVRNETGTSGFMKAFKNDYDHFNPGFCDAMFFNSRRRCMNEISLDEVRGKMILLFYGVVEDHRSYGSDEGVFWGPRGSTYFEEEPWENAETKVSRNQRFLEEARTDTNAAHVRRMGWNISTYTWNPGMWFFRNRDEIVKTMGQEALGLNGEYRIGLVDFDFYEQVQEPIDNLIRSNEGCGGLKDSI
ncbi:MAG: hypothetical protein MMC23_002280 [Stictis urceolatum]|nr:hypothetical protein [Stictis urceolata]